VGLPGVLGLQIGACQGGCLFYPHGSTPFAKTDAMHVDCAFE